jgi:hypothetical protein
MRLSQGAALALVLLGGGPAAALPLLSEVFYDAVGTDDGQSFVELYGTPDSSLDGLVIEGVNGADGSVTHTLALSGTIGPDGLFVVADRTSAGTTGVADADLLLDFDFQNGPDSVVLRSAGGVIDALAYGVFAAGEFPAGEGDPALDPPAGQSLARHFANLDTNDNASDFLASAPTPGSAPLALPEPAAAGMLGLGLLGLLRLGRRR